MRTFILAPLIFTLFCTHLAAQFEPGDEENNYRYKFGIKFSAERAGWRVQSQKLFTVFNGGLQFVGRIKKSAWSTETGLYLTTKIPEVNSESLRYRYLNIPLNLRWDKNSLYLAGGVFTDYLILINNGQSAYDPTDPDRAPSFGINGAVGYEQKLNENVNFLLEFRSFRTIYDSQSAAFISFGLSVGLNYSR
jgi:hypothetical protein